MIAYGNDSFKSLSSSDTNDINHFALVKDSFYRDFLFK